MKRLVSPTFELVKGNKLTPYQLYRAKWQLFPKYKIIDRMPISVDIELNTTCNRSCVYCQQHLDKPIPIVMKTSLATSIIDECTAKGVHALKLNWRGEPLLHPDLAKIIRYATMKGILDVRINTNGDLLTKKMCRELLEAGLGMLAISVHDDNEWNELRKRIETFQHEKWFSNGGNTIVRIQKVDNGMTPEEKSYFITYWADLADEIGLEQCLDRMDATEDHRVLPDFYCDQLWHRIFVAADGSIVPCCVALKGGNELLEVLGNIREMSIEEAWHHPRLNAIREMHINGLSHGPRMCRMCGVRKTF